jgi:hypothetical protein
MHLTSYLCKAQRIHEGDFGSYYLAQLGYKFIENSLSVTGYLVGRNWQRNVNQQQSTLDIALTPEHFAAYFAVKDTQSTKPTQTATLVRESCVEIHDAYIALACLYTCAWIACIVLKFLLWRSKSNIPDSKVDYVAIASQQLFDTDDCKDVALSMDHKDKVTRRVLYSIYQ